MQDIHTLGGVGGGGGRIFSGGGVSGVERRLQPQNHPSHAPLKCPRCDSQNTKFCYYNNYNLSQPRHFCKNCRRYWTKGGVLRNVPVGGGCRKSKRSSKAKSSGDTSSSNSQAATDSSMKNEQSSNSHSSSESSSLTATTTAATKTNTVVGAGTAAEVASASATATATASSSNSSLLNFADSGFLLGQRHGDNASFDHYQPLIEQHQVSSDGQMLPISNMVSSSNDPGLLGSNQEWQIEPEKMMDVQVDPTALEPQNRERNSGVSTLDWGNVGTLNDADVTDTTVNVGGGGVVGGGGGEHGLFDFTGVDETYWNQAQWVDDSDQSFNFLPQFQVLDFSLEKK